MIANLRRNGDRKAFGAARWPHRFILHPSSILPSFILRPSSFILSLLALLLAAPAVARAASWAEQRKQMVDLWIVGAGVKNPRVIAAMRAVPRHEFIPKANRSEAYEDMAVPIGEQQTISPPFVVASMTERLDPQPTDKVLEIGTGSGYQAAVMSLVAGETYSIEIKEKLGKLAADRLKRLGFKVHTKIGDGYKGWPEHAPFDKIIVTCSPENIPQPLIDQLRDGGRMIVPVGQRFQQLLYLFHKKDGKLTREALEATMFVPMTGTAESLRQVEYDAEHPALVNGGLEAATQIKGVPDGWYYVRQGTLVEDKTAPEGRQYLKIINSEPGKFAQALQAFGVDGRKVRELDLSIWVRGRDIRPPRGVPDRCAHLMLSYYDEDRAPIRQEALGPWSGTFDWTEKNDTVRVPRNARMVVLYIGLLGATGEVSFDDIRIAPHASEK